MRKIEIDFETLDRITLVNLKDYRKRLKNELKRFKSGEYLHEDDVVKNAKLIDALDLIISCYE